MIRHSLLALSTALFCNLSVASGGIGIVFTESAPKDRFAITNTSECMIDKLVVGIDLSSSAGQLIFDTTSTGAGVEVFQAFEPEQSKLSLVSSKTVSDGDTALTVQVDRLQPGETASFTIDVDDQLAAGELGMIRVTDSEMSGTRAQIEINGVLTLQGSFNADNQVLIGWASCAG